MCLKIKFVLLCFTYNFKALPSLWAVVQCFLKVSPDNTQRPLIKYSLQMPISQSYLFLLVPNLSQKFLHLSFVMLQILSVRRVKAFLKCCSWWSCQCKYIPPNTAPPLTTSPQYRSWFSSPEHVFLGYVYRRFFIL